MSSPKKNFIYNIIYQVLILVIPFITAPYLARVVGAAGVGTYSYTYSIAHCFMLATLLGVNNYGNRTIAKVRNNRAVLSKKFWEIYALQLLCGLIMLIGYVVYVFCFCSEFKDIAMIQIIFIISAILDINWFFFGMEEFKKTITRNIIIKLGNLVLIFLLVKSKGDLGKYTFIMAGMTCVGQIIMWSYLRQKVKLVRVKFRDVMQHLKPNLILFIPVVALNLFKMMDKLMLGWLVGVAEVGYYENAERIANMPMSIISALGTVMMPRISNIITLGKTEQVHRYISKSMDIVMFMAFSMCFGLIAVGKEFAPIYFGSEFEKSGTLIMLLSLTLPFLSFANVIRMQYLIPHEKDKIYIRSLIIGAVVNLIMNLVCIPRLQSIGASIATVSAEMVVMSVQAYSIRKELPIKQYIKNIVPFFIKGSIMLAIVYPIKYLHINSVVGIMIQIALGGAIYCLLNCKYIFSIVDFKKIMAKFVKQFAKTGV